MMDAVTIAAKVILTDEGYYLQKHNGRWMAALSIGNIHEIPDDSLYLKDSHNMKRLFVTAQDAYEACQRYDRERLASE